MWPHALTNRANVPRVGWFSHPSSVFAPFPATEYNKGGSPFRPNLAEITSVTNHNHLIPDARDFDAHPLGLNRNPPKSYGARGGTRTRMATRPRDFLTTIAFATAFAFVVWTLPSSVLDGECQVSTPSLSGLARRYHRQGFTEFTRIQSKDSSLAAQLLLMGNLSPLRKPSPWCLPFHHPGIGAPVWHLL